MRIGRKTLVAIVPLALVAAACGGGGDKTVETTVAPATTARPATTAAPAPTTEAAPTTTLPPKPKSVTVRPLFTRGDSGGVGSQKISIGDSTDNALRLEFSEDEVGGLGDQSRAAAWSAVTVATLLTGKPLQGEYNIEISGPIDGPSAGALMTVGVLSLLAGTEIATDITMTGTINPDGTVGPVGGIPEKIKGAAAEGFKRILIPVGQRNTESKVTGQLVDVVDLGKRNGVTVTEAKDVYQAYEAFTGEQLPKLTTTADPRLDEKTYTRLKAKADEFLAKYQESTNAFLALDPSIQDPLNDLALQAQDSADRAANLENQGLQGGAFTAASQAAALMDAAAGAGQALQILSTQGIDPFLTRVGQSEAIKGQVFAFFDSLKTFEPKTVSDASSLMQAYAAALDSLSIANFAGNQIDNVGAAVNNGQITLEDAIPELFLPLVYYEIAGTGIDVAKSIFEVGRDLGGAEISQDVDLTKTADFFRKGSDANFAALQSNVIKEYANQYGQSEDAMLGGFANADIDVALSLSQRNTIEGLQDYIGAGEANAEYALLGFGIANYARNALLVEKYYSNGVLDDDLNITGVRSDAALISGLELGKAQLAASIANLRDQGVEPALEAAQYEIAAVEREGDVNEKFNALSDYWSGYLASRVLAYLGGFESNGLDGN
jgi:uncharacterized protein